MKKGVKLIGFSILIILVGGLIYNLYDANKKINNSYHTNKHLNDLKLLNKDINIILASPYVQNFDGLKHISEDIDFALLSALYHVRETNILKDVESLSKLFEEKKELIHDFKSTDAILSNSYKNILKFSKLIRKKMTKKSETELINRVLNSLVKLNLKREISRENFSISKELVSLKKLYKNVHTESTMMELFIANIEVFESYYNKLKMINNQNKALAFEKKIDQIINSYELYNNDIIADMERVIAIFVVLIVLFLIFLFLLSAKLDGKVKDIENVNERLEDKTKELKRSLDIISKNVIYSKSDLRGVIVEASEAFCKISGYSMDELILQPHSIIRHKDMPKHVFKTMWRTIKSGKVWNGELKNLKKDGSSYWVKVNISPEFDKEGNITGFVAIREDITLKKEMEAYNENLGKKITQEVEKNRQKDKLLQEQSRLAQMGEMISMIAHQWRQPLSAISSTSMNVQMKLLTKHYDLDMKEDREIFLRFLDNKLNLISEYVQVLSSTIDDFRNFFKPNKEKEMVCITYPIEKALSIVDALMQERGVKILSKYETQEDVYIYQNEIMQVVLNILKNSEDNFIEKEIQSPQIEIVTKKEDDCYLIQIFDNGGGIQEDILPNIFDPYFSTKSEKNGTGLGLYMSKVIVQEHNDGKLNVFNTRSGVCFEIRLRSYKN